METTRKRLEERIVGLGGVRIVECDGPYGGRLHFYILGRKIVLVWVSADGAVEQLFLHLREQHVGDSEVLIDRLAKARQ